MLTKPPGTNGEHLSIRVGLLLPIGQALLTGILTGGVTLAISTLAGWKQAQAIAAAAATIAALIAWLALLRGWRLIVASQAGVELNPPPLAPDEPRSTLLEMSINDGATLRYAELPASFEQLRALAAGVLGGATLSESVWTPGLFTRSEFAKVKAALVRRGLAENRSRDPARGIQLTRAGEAAFSWLATLAGAPPTRPMRLTPRR